MMNRKEMLDVEKECAELLGETLEQYHENLKNIKVSNKKVTKEKKFDNSILNKLGLSPEILKHRKAIQ